MAIAFLTAPRVLMLAALLAPLPAVGPAGARTLADRVQDQTGIPYLLVDGSLAHADRAYELIGDLLREPARAREPAVLVLGGTARVCVPVRRCVTLTRPT